MKSIRAQLLAGLILGLGAMSVLAAYAIFQSALKEANELFDYELRSVAVSLSESVPDTELASRGTGNLGGLQDDRLIIQAWNAAGAGIYRSAPRAALPRQGPGYWSIEVHEKHYRVFGLQQPKRFIQVGQPMTVRDELALQLASRTLLPLLALVPLEILLVLLVVKRALRPLTTLSGSLATRSIDTLTLVDAPAGIPHEVQPLVSALNDLLRRLDRALQAQRIFVADAAHELRTPLTALKLQIQSAAQDKREPDDLLLFRKLEDRVNRAIRLVQQLLTLAREDAEIGARAGVVDLSRTAARVVGELSVLAEHKRIDLGLSDAGDPVPNVPIMVAGDEHSLMTLVTNLIDNAIRYTPPGGKIDVRLRACETGAQVEVVDDGPGIPEADLERVLDRFYRVNNAHEQGSGLGLAIAARIAAKHGATLRLQNRTSGHGLQAILSGLPRAAPSYSASPHQDGAIRQEHSA